MDRPPAATSGKQLVEPLQKSMEAQPSSHVRPSDVRCCASVRSCMPQGATRNALFDNVKGACSFLVVFMHVNYSTVFVRDASDGILAKFSGGFMSFALLCAMPGFSFVSGFLSTATPQRKQHLGNVRLLLTYTIQHLIWMPTMYQWVLAMNAAEDNALTGTINPHPRLRALPFPFFSSFNIDWYILSVVVWRTFLPMIASVRFSVLVSVAFSIASLFIDVSSMDQAQVTFTFLPYFLAGFHFKGVSCRLQSLRRHAWARSVPAILVLSCVLFASFVHDIDVSPWVMCLYGGFTRDGAAYEHPEDLANLTQVPRLQMSRDTHCMSLHGVGQVLACYGISSLCIAALVLGLPDRVVPVLTKAGENAIYIYLTHLYFAMMLFGVLPLLSHQQGIVFSWMFVVALWLFLSTGWQKFVCKPCIEPPTECCHDNSIGPHGP